MPHSKKRPLRDRSCCSQLAVVAIPPFKKAAASRP
jgi:hypothetical protein